MTLIKPPSPDSPCLVPVPHIDRPSLGSAMDWLSDIYWRRGFLAGLAFGGAFGSILAYVLMQWASGAPFPP